MKAWADSLGGIDYPLLSDFYPHGKVAEEYGVLRQEGYSERAIVVIDKQGVIRYIDVHAIDQQPDNELLFKVLEELEPQSAWQRKAAAPIEQALTAIETPSDVVLYCTPWCPDCRKARAFLNERGIPYTEIDITRNAEAAKQVRAWANGYETTPSFNIQGNIIVNFSEEKLEKALKALKK